MKPHKHAEVIKAYLKGEEIQIFSPFSREWVDCRNPLWNKRCQYRIKPTKKKQLYTIKVTDLNGSVIFEQVLEGEIKITYEYQKGY